MADEVKTTEVKDPLAGLANFGAKNATIVPSAQMSKSSTKKTYYSRLDGARYVFGDGGVAIFTGARFEFDPAVVPADYEPPAAYADTPEKGWAKRFKELEYQAALVNNPVFSGVEVPIQRSDAKVLREVGHAGGGTASGVGIAGSQALQGTFAQSNS